MIYDTENNRVNLGNYNESLFTIASKLDKCLMLIVACGFSGHGFKLVPVFG